MGYQTNERGTGTAPGHEAKPEPRPAPGKATRTEKLRTGIPVIDDGTACKRDPTLSCYLAPEDRMQLVNFIGLRAGIIADNARDAIADSRVDELVKTESGWGFLAEFVFYGVTGWMIGGVMKIVKDIEKAKKYEEHIQAALTNASRGFRKTLQGSAAAAGDHAKASKVRFLELVRDGVPLWQTALVEESTADLDDDGLVALKDALDPAKHTVGEFKAKLAGMLARFDRQQIDQAGVETTYRHGELVRIKRGGKWRLVMLEDHGLHHTPDVTGTTKPRDLVEKLARDGRPIVIDPDLEPMAIALFAERTGRQPMEIDPEAALALGGTLARIGRDLFADAVAAGDVL